MYEKELEIVFKILSVWSWETINNIWSWYHFKKVFTLENVD